MTGLEIREAVAEDADSIALLAGQLGYPSSPLQVAERLARIGESEDHRVLIACRPDGTLAGWLHMLLALRVESDPFAEITGLVVCAGHRRRGVGRRLLSAARDWAEEQGAAVLRVRSSMLREDAREFYQRMGFSLTKEQRVFDMILREG